MTYYPTCASILLRLTLLGGCVLSVTASALGGHPKPTISRHRKTDN